MQEGNSAKGSEGVSMVMGTDRHRLGGGKEAGGRDNDNIRVRTGGGVGRGIERGLGRRGGISVSERVEWSRMKWSGRVINQYRRREGNTSGGGRRSRKKLNIKRDRV